MKKILVILAIVCCGFVPVDTVSNRFAMPTGFQAQNSSHGAFGDWLGKLPLKAKATHTLTYKGDIARTDAYTAAVVDLSIGTQDLQQCADAVMRLRAEYLYQQKLYRQIAFNFTSGFRCDYQHYAEGYRFVKDRWVLKAGRDYGYDNFQRYLKLVFTYAGTISLEKELVKANDGQVCAGDVFIHGGSPGHCFIVLKVCADKFGQQKFLLAQSFMPAQNIQVLQQNGDAWFSLSRSANIPYGELVAKQYHKRFKS